MDFSKPLFLVAALVCLTWSFSQIVTRQNPDAVPQPVTSVQDSVRPKRVPTDGTNEFSFYLGGAVVSANRMLKENDNYLYADPLGKRADEKRLTTFAYQLGLRNQVNKWFAYDAALSLEKNGESYNYDDPDSDSTYSYETTYNYIALPVQVYFTHGNDLRFFIGGGIQPELFINYNQDISYTTKEQRENTANVDRLDKAQSFLFGLVASAGVQYKIGRVSSVYLGVGKLWNLNSTYNDQAAYSHKARNSYLKFGLVFHIPNN